MLFLRLQLAGPVRVKKHFCYSKNCSLFHVGQKSEKSPFFGLFGWLSFIFSPSKHQTDCSNLCLCISTTDLSTVSGGCRSERTMICYDEVITSWFFFAVVRLPTDAKESWSLRGSCAVAPLHIGGDFTDFHLRNGHLGEVCFLQITKVFFNMLIHNRLKMKK